MRLDDLFDLSQLDSEAANLYLLVVTTQELNVAVETVASEIASLVNFVANIFGEWIVIRIVNKTLVGQVLSVTIAKRYACSADVDFAFTANWYFVTVRIEDVDLRVADWFADQDLGIAADDLECG